MRKRDCFGDAISSGANDRKSPARRSITSTMGSWTWVVYWSLRARNHSRSLLRFSARRKLIVLGVNTPTILFDLELILDPRQTVLAGLEGQLVLEFVGLHRLGSRHRLTHRGGGLV